MAGQFGLGNALGATFDAFNDNAQTQFKIRQAELARADDNSYRAATLAQTDKQLALQDEIYRNELDQLDVIKERWDKTHNLQQEEFNRLSRGDQIAYKEKLEASRVEMVSMGAKEFNNMAGTTPLAEWVQQSPENIGAFKSWVRDYGGAFKLFDYKGRPRDFVNIEDAPEGGGFVITLRDPQTGSEGPMTDGGGQGGKEKVVTISEADLPGILQRIDNQINGVYNSSRAISNEVAASQALNQAAYKKRQDGLTPLKTPDRTGLSQALAAPFAADGANVGRYGNAPLGTLTSSPQVLAAQEQKNAAEKRIAQELDRGLYNRVSTGAEVLANQRLVTMGQRTKEQALEAIGGNTTASNARSAESTNQAKDSIAAAQVDLTRYALQAKNAFDASLKLRELTAAQREQYNEDFAAVIDIGKNAFNGILDTSFFTSTETREAEVEVYAQQFQVLVANGLNDPRSSVLYQKALADPAQMAGMAKSFAQFEKARSAINDGDTRKSGDGFWMRNIFKRAGQASGLTDAITPDLPQQSLDAAMLGTTSGLGMRNYILDVLIPVGTTKNSSIPSSAYSKINSLLIEEQKNRKKPMSRREIKEFIKIRLEKA